MTRRRWYLEHETVTLTIPAEGGEHRISWRRGRLVLHDHDVEAEDVLRALGGEVCPCLAIRDWVRAATRSARQAGWSDVTRVTLARASMRMTARARALPGTAPQPGPYVPPPPPTAGRPGLPPPPLRAPGVPGPPPPLPPLQGRPALRTILTRRLEQLQSDSGFQRLPLEQRNHHLHQLRQQLAQAIVQESAPEILNAINRVRRERHVARSAVGSPAKLSLAELLELRARPALEQAMRQSLPYLWPKAPVSIAVWKDTPGEPPLLQGDFTSRGGFVAVSLPVHWLTRVSARGLACLDGHFVLDVDAPAPASRLHAQVLRWERRLGGHWAPAPIACSIERQAGRWQLTGGVSQPGS
ncbi:MAG: hypothetical protein JO352_33500 [Chloroflexi bacterium]|nr:hypothetical protein [Chloroflexota bacterium]